MLQHNRMLFHAAHYSGSSSSKKFYQSLIASARHHIKQTQNCFTGGFFSSTQTRAFASSSSSMTPTFLTGTAIHANGGGLETKTLLQLRNGAAYDAQRKHTSPADASNPKFYEPSIEWDADEHSASHNAELRLRRHIEQKYGIKFDTYHAWWRWTCDNYAEFWETLLHFCDIRLSTPYTRVVEDEVPMDMVPRWFLGAKLNFAENCLRRGADDQPAFIQAKSSAELFFYDFRRLRADVQLLATEFRDRFKLTPGDRICAYAPNCFETAVSFFACAAIGAVWSSASVDFGPDGVLDRFAQVEPKLLVVTESATYKGREHSLIANVNAILRGLPSVKSVLVLPSTTNKQTGDLAEKNTVYWQHLFPPTTTTSTTTTTNGNAEQHADRTNGSSCGPQPFIYEQVSFNHPLYILFSSGTTGKPKAMVHTVGGTLLKHVAEHCVQTNFGPGDRVFFYTTCGWMMWNWLMSVLYTGATAVVFDESPLSPDPFVLLRITQAAGVTALGAGAKIYDEWARLDDEAGGAAAALSERFDFTPLRLVLSTASPLKPQTFEWINARMKPGVQIASICGGTDLVGCLMGSTLNRPVVAGECQHFLLGMDAACYDFNGNEVHDQRGELVCRRPFPSMPSHFVNDADGVRYRRAYFARFPGVWTHGDFISVSSKTGGVSVFGRSDTTLNRGGVRIGTAEIYNVVDSFPQIQDSVVVGRTDPCDANNETMMLFVVLKNANELSVSAQLKAEICTALRRRVSPRHVPDEVHAVPDIPYTNSGKKVELAVKQCVCGKQVEKASTLRNPECLDHFLAYAVQQQQ